MTRFVMTVIPYFREVVISAFECPHCGFRNTGIQSAAQIAERGVQFDVQVRDRKDLTRQIVKSEYASVRFPDLDLELPSKSGTGFLTTVEGLVERVLGDMKGTLANAADISEDAQERIGAIAAKLESYLREDQPFTLILDDVTGNSYVENFCAPRADPRVKELRYRQDPARLAELGFATSDQPKNEDGDEEEEPEAENVHSFNTKCPECLDPCKTRMTMVEIPYFKEVLLMATSCDSCGYKTNEVKTGGAIAPKGRRITLKMTSIDDLSRDILKSETCHLAIPEIDLELHMGTLGGRFTTIEGLLTQVHRELEERVPFSSGDSAPDAQKQIFARLLASIKSICQGTQPCTLVLEDPLGNSYIQNLWAPDQDPMMVEEEFERTDEQNEDLGISDMKTEDY